MDEQPIVYTRYIAPRNFPPHHSILFQSLYFALAHDEKDEFMRLITDPGFEQVRYYFTAEEIFRNDALEIAIDVCVIQRKSMEVVRMLVRSMQNTWTRQAFLKYAHKGELRKLAVLFLAVPELFLSSPESELSLLSKLDLKLNSLENKKDIGKQLSLLLDVFALVGQKLAAYIRLEEYALHPPKRLEQSHLEVDFFLREVARKKPGVSTLDYYLSFFEADQQDSESEDDDDLTDWDDCVSDLEGLDIFHILSYLVMRKDFVRTDIYRLIPSLEPQDADRLSVAIQEKLSSVSASQDCLETSAKTSVILKKMQKQQPPAFSNFSTRCFEPSVRSFYTSAGSANSMFAVKFTPKKSWESKVIQSTKLKSFSFVKLSHLPLVAKRLLK